MTETFFSCPDDSEPASEVVNRAINAAAAAAAADKSVKIALQLFLCNPLGV